MIVLGYSMRKGTQSKLGCWHCVHQRWTSAGRCVRQLCTWQTDRPALYLIGSQSLEMKNAKAAKTLIPTTHQTTLTKLKL